MKKSSIFLCVFLTSVLLLIPIAPVQSNSIYLHNYTATPPIIDGNLNSFSGEWANAATQEFDTSYGTTSLHGKIYVMNTQTDLFIAVEINDGTNNGVNDWIQVGFDNDNDGTVEVGDDNLMVRGDSTFTDQYVRSASIGVDSSFGGSSDGSGAASWGSSWTYEISHPLKSGDIGYDFQLSIGDIVGFTLRFYNNGDQSYWPAYLRGAGFSAEEYGDIGIDPPPPPLLYVEAPHSVDVSTEFDIIISIRDIPSGWGMIYFGILAEWDPTDLEYIECEFLGDSRPGWTGDCSWPDAWEGGANGPRWTEDAAWFRIRFHCLREGPAPITVSSPPLGTVVLEDSVGTQEAVFPEPVTVTIYQGLGPVGGVTSPVNKTEVLTPYLALAGLIAAVSTIYVIKKRKD